jgi:hypothetical protein
LAAFGSTTQEHYHIVAVPTVIRSISGTETNTYLGNTSAKSPVVTKIPHFDTVDSDLNPSPDFAVLVSEPITEVIHAAGGDVMDDPHCGAIVAKWLHSVNHSVGGLNRRRASGVPLGGLLVGVAGAAEQLLGQMLSH